ncbi:MAG: hypothetical protein AAGL89_03860 [Pseudomonadota bacterium]
MSDCSRKCDNRMALGDQSLAALNVDPVEFGFLSAARYFCLSFSEPHGGAWVTAMLSAECFFPGAGSAEKMRRALAVVQEMRTSRRSTFRFSNPRCEICSGIVTEDERHLLQLIQHARARNGSLVASSAMLLCEGRNTDHLRVAAQEFAELVGTSMRDSVEV